MSSALQNNRLAHDVFVGREREITLLRTTLEETLAGHGRAVVLLGEPGIGKTRLASELTTQAQARGMRILIGRCPDSDGAPPYWLWVQIVRSYVSESDVRQLQAEMSTGAADLAQVIPAVRERLPDLPSPSRLESEQERFRFFDSFTTFLKNVAKRQPLLLMLDDLQWADVPSLLFLQFLVRELNDMKLFLVITCRDSEVVPQPLLTQTLAAIARASGSQTLHLRGLTDSDVARFMELITGQASPTEVSRAIFQRTEGHPFFMTEIVRLLATEQLAATYDPASTSLPVLPPTVRSVVEQRLATVSRECRQMLTAAAVIGREFQLQVLEAVIDQWERRLAAPACLVEGPSNEGSVNNLSALELLDEALTARLLVPVPQNLGRYSFTHALIQETLYEGIATAERLTLHRRIGESLEVRGSDSVASHLSELAHHFFQAAQSGREIDKAIVYATRAAECATAMLAYEEAIPHYERALQMLSLNDPDETLRCEMLLALGKAQNRAGDVTAAQEQFQQAATLARTRQLSIPLAHAALGLAGTRIPISGPNPTILQILHEALALLPQDAYALRAQLLARLAKELAYSDSHEQREQCSHEAISLARYAADPHALGYALCDHCVATWRPDTLSERLATSVELSALAVQLGDPELILYSNYLRIANALEQGDIVTLDAESASFARAVTEIRPPMYTWLWFNERFQTMRALLPGQFAEAEKQLLALSESLPHTPDRHEAGALMFPQFLLLRREQGRLQEPELEAMLKHAAEQYPGILALRCALAYVRCETGREAEARVEFEYWATQDFMTVPHRQDRLVVITYLAEMCTTWGDAARAAQLYDLLLPYAERNIVLATALGYFDCVAHLLGKLATVLSRYNDAQAHFEFALQRNMQMGARPRLAHTQYSYAGMLFSRNHAGDSEQAVMLLDQALAIAQELGMGGLVDKVQNSKFKVQSKTSPASKNQPAPSFRNDGEYWTVRFENVECRLKDSRGLHYLAQLLRYPHHEFSALDLVNLGMAAPDTASSQRAADMLADHASVTTGGDAGELLDPQAKAAYQQRLKELREELEEAQEFNDIGRVEKLEEESEFLVQELSRAVGLGGRRRKAGSAAERARLNVTVTLKNTIARITKHHKALGQHLAHTIKTGTFCSYAPDPALVIQRSIE
jgi:tetratricopeptide (TPR) repeat protein